MAPIPSGTTGQKPPLSPLEVLLSLLEVLLDILLLSLEVLLNELLSLLVDMPLSPP